MNVSSQHRQITNKQKQKEEDKAKQTNKTSTSLKIRLWKMHTPISHSLVDCICVEEKKGKKETKIKLYWMNAFVLDRDFILFFPDNCVRDNNMRRYGQYIFEALKDEVEQNLVCQILQLVQWKLLNTSLKMLSFD